MGKVEVEFSDDEMEFLNAMAEYLHKRKALEKASVEDVVKYACLKVLGPIVLKEIEERRV